MGLRIRIMKLLNNSETRKGGHFFMQRQQTIDFSKFCGRDENGELKAICTLQVASVDTETRDIKEIDAVSVLNSEVAIDIGTDIVTIDVKFENYLDFEYLQAGELCLRFKEKHSNQEYDESVALLLTITESGEYHSDNFKFFFTSKNSIYP